MLVSANCSICATCENSLPYRNKEERDLDQYFEESELRNTCEKLEEWKYRLSLLLSSS